MAESGSGGSGDGRVSRCGPEPKHDPLLDGAVPGNSQLKLGSRSEDDVLESEVVSDGVARMDAIPPPSSFKGQHAMSFYRLHESSSLRYALEKEGVNTAKLLQQVGNFVDSYSICSVVSSPRALELRSRLGGNCGPKQ